METEHDKTLQALRTAIQMEIDGKEYYLKAGQKSGNELGRKLLQSLAAEEDIHRRKFEKIFEFIRNKKAWPAATFQLNEGKGPRTVFAEAMEEIGTAVVARATELDALVTAMDMENKTYDFYKSQGEKTAYNVEREYYESLAGEERGHHAVLLDYYEYLKDPAGWFVKKEHPSLDGS